MSEPQRTQNKSEKKTRGYGDWPSAISPELIVADSINIDEPRLTASASYYLERRPQENGRCVIVRASRDDNTQDFVRSDILPPPFSARSRVHEYGGGSYCVGLNEQETVYFVNDSDQDIYRISDAGVERITDIENCRFADIIIDPQRHRLLAVCEQHRQNNVINTLVAIDINDGHISTLRQGEDFYASPRLNAKADRLCWQSWNLPNMPWDGNHLSLADLDADGNIVRSEVIAGSDTVSVFQPQWSPDDVLYYIADDTGWWHIYCYRQGQNHGQSLQLTDGEKEFGLPQWVFAQSTYAFIDARHILCSYRTAGQMQLALLTVPSVDELKNNMDDSPAGYFGRLQVLNSEWQEYSAITAYQHSACFIAASGRQFPALVLSTLTKLLPESIPDPAGDNDASRLTTSIIRHFCQLPLSAEHFSVCQTLSFQNQRQQTVYANYYPPSNPDYAAAAGDKPPLIVICHGGPTGQSGIALDPRKQFWTSRGFALLDVNYSGSTGYGRDYRQRLQDNWGILDVQDCCDAAEHAVSCGLADGERLIIRGSSAGGYTVLCALTFHQVFSAGASYYGIAELASLASDTHKFESRYLDQLVGPYPEAEAIYRQRSPLDHAEQLECPVIFFQGIDDRVVPRQQADRMFAALAQKGLTVAAQFYVGEQHGFRKAGTIVQSLQNELSFYRLVFAMRPAEDIRFHGDILLRNTAVSRARKNQSSAE